MVGMVVCDEHGAYALKRDVLLFKSEAYRLYRNTGIYQYAMFPCSYVVAVSTTATTKTINVEPSERITHRKMESKIPTEIGVQQRVFIFSGISRIYSFHTSVEPEDKEIKFKPQT